MANAKESNKLDELRRRIYKEQGKDLLEDAVGGYIGKTIAFIGCNPHSLDSKHNSFINWVNSRDNAVDLKMKIADRIPDLKCIAFKKMPDEPRQDELLNVDGSFSGIQDNEFIAYLLQVARTSKKQYHYNVGKYFKELLALTDIPLWNVYRTICAKSIFLEIFKMGTPTQNEIDRFMKPSIEILTGQLDWLLDNGLQYIVFVGNKAHKFQSILVNRFPGIGVGRVIKIPHFSPMPAAVQKWHNADSHLKESLAKIWASC